MKPPLKKRCVICAAPFAASWRQRKAIFCSAQCRKKTAAWHRGMWPRKKRRCLVCGTGFVSNSRKYCSRACSRVIEHGKRRIARGIHNLKVKCTGCGSAFICSHGRTRQFCSYACYKKHWHIVNVISKRPLLTKACKCCGRTFVQNRVDRQLCSRRCRSGGPTKARERARRFADPHHQIGVLLRGIARLEAEHKLDAKE